MSRAVPWLLAVALAWVSVQGACDRRALEAAEEERDSLRTAELEARAEAAGWEARLIEETAGLERVLRASSRRVGILQDEKAALAREVETLGGRLAAVADLYAAARARLDSIPAEVHGAEPERPDSVSARFGDGLLEGRITYRPLPQVFDLQYSVHVGLTAAVAEAPDGRGLLAIRAEDPRVELSYGETLFQRPEPVRVCTIGQQVRAGLIGVGLSEAVQAVGRALTPNRQE